MRLLEQLQDALERIGGYLSGNEVRLSALGFEWVECKIKSVACITQFGH